VIRSSSIKLATILSAALIVLAPAVGTADDSAEAQKVADRAIADIAAWKLSAAKNYLEGQKAAYGSSAEYQTAWTILEVMEATGKDAKKTQQRTNALANQAKAGGLNAPADYWRGEFLYQQNKKGDAKSAWQAASKNAAKAVAEDPTDATAQFYLGAALVREKRFADARKALVLAVRGGFDEAMVNHQIGLSHMFAEEWGPAREAFDLALAVDPQFAPSYFWRGMAWDKLGEKAKLVNYLDQFVKLAPNAPEAGRARAVLKSAGG
jgi:tetratricopeptide (TPR) repeat protein